jgi:hypothetical protein
VGVLKRERVVDAGATDEADGHTLTFAAAG